MAASPLLELKNLSCERDQRFLFAQLSDNFFAGQVIQILGPNGSGKTTLLKIIAGVSPEFQGDIYWQGQSVKNVSWDYSSDLLYIGHLAGIKKSLTPLENLRWYASARGSITDKDILAALAEVELSGYEDTPCYHLSAGQLRRVALARLAFNSAKILILDEPFTALDKSGVEQLEARLSRHSAGGGLIILTSHQDIAIPGVRKLDLVDFASKRALKIFEEPTYG